MYFQHYVICQLGAVRHGMEGNTKKENVYQIVMSIGVELNSYYEKMKAQSQCRTLKLFNSQMFWYALVTPA